MMKARDLKKRHSVFTELLLKYAQRELSEGDDEFLTIHIEDQKI